MLILARRVGEALMIGDEIEIKIVELSGDQIKVGIKAPKKYRIMRKELCLTRESNIEAANQAAPKAAFLSFLAEHGIKESDEPHK